MWHLGTGTENCLSLKATEQRMSNPFALEPAYIYDHLRKTIDCVVSLLRHAIEFPSGLLVAPREDDDRDQLHHRV